METILNNLTVLQLLHVDYSIKNLPKKLALCLCVLKWELWSPCILATRPYAAISKLTTDVKTC